MTAPLQGGFCLADINPKKCFRETEFLYGSEMPKAPGYLKGFIDLVFEYQDKYYLLDWKSNWLGPEDCDYRAENLKSYEGAHMISFRLNCIQMRSGGIFSL